MSSSCRVTVTPCYAPNSATASGWIVAGPGGVLRSASSASGAQSALQDAVGALLRTYSKVEYTIYPENPKVEAPSSGYYTQDGKHHMGPAVKAEAKPGTKPEAQPKPAANRPHVTERGGRGQAHPGLFNAAKLYQAYVREGKSQGIPFDYTRKAWKAIPEEVKSALKSPAEAAALARSDFKTPARTGKTQPPAAQAPKAQAPKASTGKAQAPKPAASQAKPPKAQAPKPAASTGKTPKPAAASVGAPKPSTGAIAGLPPLPGTPVSTAARVVKAPASAGKASKGKAPKAPGKAPAAKAAKPAKAAK